MTIKEYTRARIFDMYQWDVENLKENLEKEGLPSTGSEFEIKHEAIKRSYPELFGDNGDEWID